MIQFACESCGSPSIAPPSEVHDEAPVRCGGCGVGLGSWGEFKRAASRLIHDHAGAPLDRRALGADPLYAPDLSQAAG